tara:strand:+ start:886 stop:1770 length:885 start_codon:yes stop_codon:yes gene_type:complete
MQYSFLKSSELRPLQDELLKFEEQFIYPFDSKRFFYISHGKDYTAFYDKIGETCFFLGYKDNQIKAVIALVKKKVEFRSETLKAIYLGDLKIDYRLHQYKAMETFISDLFSNSKAIAFYELPDLIFFVSMAGKKGSILRGFKEKNSLHKKVKHLGTVMIYMIEPQKLKKIRTFPFFDENLNLLNLSPKPESKMVISNQGCKDLQFISENKKMNLAHINLGALQGSQLLQRIQKAGVESEDKYDILCFALDTKRTSVINLLKNQGIVAGSKADVGSFLFGHDYFETPLTINTNEI